MILQSISFLMIRFGLYGTPFDPELFDVDPPVSGKSSSVPLTYASVVQGDTNMNTTSTTGATAFGGDSLDLRELLATPGKTTFTFPFCLLPNLVFNIIFYLQLQRKIF